MATFIKGQLVKFNRNSVVKSLSTTVSAVLPLVSGQPQMYIIEYLQGWTPNAMRITQFGLDGVKKYLFVKESELTVI